MSVESLGDLSKWIPSEGGGYDIFAIGLQESQISSEILQAIHSHLGNTFAFPFIHPCIYM